MSDDILHDIDDVITDWQGSRDSMHWAPAPQLPADGILRVELERPGAWWHRSRRSGS